MEIDLIWLRRIFFHTSLEKALKPLNPARLSENHSKTKEILQNSCHNFGSCQSLPLLPFRL